MDLFTSLTEQWKQQYEELAAQQRLIAATLQSLEQLIALHEQHPAAAATREPVAEVAAETAAPAAPRQAAALPADPGYDREGSWAYKIDYVLQPGRSQGIPLPVADIATAIHQIEPHLDLNRIIKAVTMEASKMGLNGRLGIKKKGNKNFYFITEGAVPPALEPPAAELPAPVVVVPDTLFPLG